MRHTIIKTLLCLCMLTLGALRLSAQNDFGLDSIKIDKAMLDSIGIDKAMLDSIGLDNAKIDSVVKQGLAIISDTLAKPQPKPKKDWNTWRPDPKRALWLALVIPGGGQIYNRKYWKLPIIYGGFLGCVYALNWNNMMYRDYSQAYIDIMDSDPNTKSYENFIPRGYDIERNLTRIKDLFRRKKDYYRRYRDLSIFAMIGVYALSIVDAYVDAELSSFDISRDLSMKVSPSVIRQGGELAVRQPYGQQAYGVRCSVSF